MSIKLTIDGKEITTREGKTILEAARENDIDIPSFCYNDELKPFGVCRICTVEVTKGNRTRTVASCAYPVQPGITVTTRSERIDKIRRVLLEFILEQAPQIPEIRELAHTYNAEKKSFTDIHRNYCILCGNCVNYCAQVKGKNLVGFMGRGTDRAVVFPEANQVPPRECLECHECYSLCPTGVFPVVGNI